MFKNLFSPVIVIAYVLCFSVTIFSGEGGIRIDKGPLPKYIALTFDDGPHEGYTPKILEMLKKYQVKATFFVVGKQVAKYPLYVKDINRDGHEICDHTYSHPNLSSLDDQAIVRELDWTRTLVQKLTGQECNYFRPPGGRYNWRVVQAAGKAGYKMILWSVFPQDHRLNYSSEVAQKVLRDAYDGSVVLLHSGKESTIEALPEIILQLRKQGYEFVTIADLVRRDRNSPNLYTFLRSSDDELKLAKMGE